MLKIEFQDVEIINWFGRSQIEPIEKKKPIKKQNLLFLASGFNYYAYQTLNFESF